MLVNPEKLEEIFKGDRHGLARRSGSRKGSKIEDSRNPHTRLKIALKEGRAPQLQLIKKDMKEQTKEEQKKAKKWYRTHPFNFFNLFYFF